MTLTTLARPVSTPRSRLHLLTMMRQLNDDAEALLTVTRSKNPGQTSTTLTTRVMNSPLVPSIGPDLHFVLCAFGRSGLAYAERPNR